LWWISNLLVHEQHTFPSIASECSIRCKPVCGHSVHMPGYFDDVDDVDVDVDDVDDDTEVDG
jgi:hypothetical protein